MKTTSSIALLFAVSASLVLPAFAQIGDPDEAPKADSRVRAALDRASLKYRVDSDGDFRLTFEVDDDRTHVVFINSNTEEYGDMEVREIWAVGATSETGFSAAKLEELLKKNGTYKIGAWHLTKNGQRAVFTVVVSARANSDTIDSMVRLVAKTADGLEKEWLGTDEF